MLEKHIIDQLREIFANLSSDYTFKALCDPASGRGGEMIEFLKDITATSDKLSLDVEPDKTGKLEFSIIKGGGPVGIVFRGIPNGHEFNSLLLAILNSEGIGKNLPDEYLRKRIESLKGPVEIVTYVSLTCTNCSDVVQALNIIAICNPGITSVVVDGGMFDKEVEKLNIMAVPTVFANGEQLSVGRTTLVDLIGKLEARAGSDVSENVSKEPQSFDLLVLGGGPAGASAAIYATRKGARVAVIAKDMGGSVSLTTGIDNLVTQRSTTGSELAAVLRDNVSFYGSDIFENREIRNVELSTPLKRVEVAGGEIFEAPAVIVCTGSRPRRMNVPGEEDYVGRGIAFCPHCDGPMFSGKSVAVIGGGNSGIEAAIELSSICSDVEVFEFLDELKADKVLIDKAATIGNITVHLSSQVLSVQGDGSRLTGIVVLDRHSKEERLYELAGVFVQIGTVPGSELFKDSLALNDRGEIKVDRECRTSLPGVYAAGDVCDNPVNQIVTALGDGAVAAITSFNDKMRGKI